MAVTGRTVDDLQNNQIVFQQVQYYESHTLNSRRVLNIIKVMYIYKEMTFEYIKVGQLFCNRKVDEEFPGRTSDVCVRLNAST